MRESPFEIRAIPPQEVEYVTKFLVEAGSREFSKHLPAIDYNCVLEVMSKSAKANCLIGYYNNTHLCGVLAVEIDTYWWSKEPVLMDLMFYIKPEFRSYSAFNRMLSVAEEFARINKVPLALSFFTDKDLAKKGRMIMRRGYKPISWTMFRRL